MSELRIDRARLGRLIFLARARAEEANRASSALRERFGELCRPCEPGYLAALFGQPSPARAALDAFLQSLNVGEVAEAEALMYAGRDGVPLPEMRRYLARDGETKRIRVATLLSKAPLDRYLIAGRRALGPAAPRRRST